MGGSRSEVFSMEGRIKAMLLVWELSGSAPPWPVSRPHQSQAPDSIPANGDGGPASGRKRAGASRQEGPLWGLGLSIPGGALGLLGGHSAFCHPARWPSYLLFCSDPGARELPAPVRPSWLLALSPYLVSTLLPPAHSLVSVTQPLLHVTWQPFALCRQASYGAKAVT